MSYVAEEVEVARIAVLGIGLVCSLACGGGGALLGGGVGEYTRGYAEYEAGESGLPAPTFGRGDEVRVGDFTHVILDTALADPETDVKWIKNVDERRVFGVEGTQALVVRFKVRNEAPVRKKLDVYFLVMGTDGANASRGPYNDDLVQQDLGLREPQDLGDLPPGEWIESARVFALQPGAADGAAAHFKRFEKVKDARGRTQSVLREQAIVDLGAPVEAPHVNPARRAP